MLLAGIHPRNIPADLRPEDIEDILEPYLEDGLCLWIGEIGLETGRNQKKEMFSAQLSMAQQVTQRGNLSTSFATTRPLFSVFD